MAAAKSTCYLRLDKLPMKATHDDVLDMLGGMAVEEIKLEQQGLLGACGHLYCVVRLPPLQFALRRCWRCCCICAIKGRGSKGCRTAQSVHG